MIYDELPADGFWFKILPATSGSIDCRVPLFRASSVCVQSRNICLYLSKVCCHEGLHLACSGVRTVLLRYAHNAAQIRPQYRWQCAVPRSCRKRKQLAPQQWWAITFPMSGWRTALHSLIHIHSNPRRRLIESIMIVHWVFFCCIIPYVKYLFLNFFWKPVFTLFYWRHRTGCLGIRCSANAPLLWCCPARRIRWSCRSARPQLVFQRRRARRRSHGGQRVWKMRRALLVLMVCFVYACFKLFAHRLFVCFTCPCRQLESYNPLRVLRVRAEIGACKCSSRRPRH
jgi:hypothetical protein